MFAFAVQLETVGLSREGIEDVDGLTRYATGIAATEAKNTARFAIRQNAAGVPDNDRKYLDPDELGQVRESMDTALREAEGFALQFTPGDLAKSIYRK